jgi:hypothetical protein
MFPAMPSRRRERLVLTSHGSGKEMEWQEARQGYCGRLGETRESLGVSLRFRTLTLPFLAGLAGDVTRFVEASTIEEICTRASDGGRKGRFMSRSVLTLQLPEDIFERLRRAAKGMKKPMEKALVTIVRAATPSLEKVPFEYRAELEAMEDLGDDDLRKISQSRLAPAKQRRMELLLAKNESGRLTDRERQVIGSLRAAGDRLMLRRSYASLLLKYRGHQLPALVAGVRTERRSWD